MAVSLLILVGCSSAEDAASPESLEDAETAAESEVAPLGEWDELEKVDCGFEIPSGATVECVDVSVPEVPGETGGQSVTLRATRVTTETTPDDAIPVIYIEGGPGGDTLSSLSLSWGDRWRDINNERPVFFYSQRGANFSSQHLECPEEVQLALELLSEDIDDAEIYPQQLEAVQTCVDRFEADGIDLELFSSEVAANDLESLRIALGLEEVQLYGLSYGTRLAQSYVRLFGESVDKLVLDSVLTTDPDVGVGALPKGAERSFDELFEACEESERCSTAYPNLEDRFYGLYDKLEVKPLEFDTTNPLDGQNYEISLDGESFISTAFSAMYDSRLAAFVPAMVRDLERGETLSVSLLALQDIIALDFVATSMNTAVLCNDAINHVERDGFNQGLSTREAVNDGLTGGSGDFEHSKALCELFGDAKATEADLAPVTSSIEALGLAGELDPITPPSATQSVMQGFSNGTYVEFADLGHGLLGSGCGNEIIIDFLAGESIDASCSGDASISWR